MPSTRGATKAIVELPILQCLSTGGWKQPGEIKDYVTRYGELPREAKVPLKDRPAEAQANNAVQNAISPSRAGSLTSTGLIEHDAFKGAYKLTSLGKARLEDLSGNA